MKNYRKMSIIFLCILLCSCTVWKDQLMEIDDMLADDPKAALEELRQIPAHSFTSPKAKAHYSLLRSMALDKSGIDVMNDSIISDAVSYFSVKGEPLNRCRTFYYAGRIYENMMDYEMAMSYLSKTEELMELIDDEYLKSLIYSTKGRIYFESLEYRKAADNFHMASMHCRKDSETDRWASNKTREGMCLYQLKEYELAKEIIISLEKHLDNLSIATLNKYYQLHISLNIATSEAGNDTLISEYIEAVGKAEIIDWLLISRACIKDGNAAGALEYLQQDSRYNDRDARHHYILAKAHELTGHTEEALASYKEYISMSGTIGQSILTKDTEFIEEREMHQERYAKEKNRRIILSLAILVSLLIIGLAAATIINIRKQLKIESLQKENLQRQLDELILEREELALLESRNSEGRRIISERLRIIDQFVMSDAFNDDIFETKASQTLKSIINDRAGFVRQNRLIFNRSSPEFIAYLTEKGLTEIEIDHCCLYAIGMNGKMVTTFTNAKRHYHIGSDVRKKLGLNSHDTNISIYIRHLFNQMENRPCR